MSDAFDDLQPSQADALCRDLVRAARRRGVDASGVRSVRRVPLPSSWYRIERLEVDFATGDDLAFFVKDFGVYPQPKGDMEARRERERYLYEEVFRDEAVEVAQFAASVWDHGTAWLVLDFVDGVPLSWCDLPPWFDAAAWLGRMQTAVVDRRGHLRRSGRLRMHDTGYFERVADAALRAAADHGPAIAAAVEPALSRHARLAATLQEHPQTLVHGAYRPEQILIDSTGHPPRVWPTDWEVAAVGSCLYDLAMFADGFAEPELSKMLQRFLKEAAWLASTGVEPADFHDAVEAVRVHRTMNWIAMSHERRMDPATVQGLADSLVHGGRSAT